MANATKVTPYWHPQLPTPDGRQYAAVERDDIARLLSDARREQRVYRTHNMHGAVCYVLQPFKGSPWESGRVFIPTRA